MRDSYQALTAKGVVILGMSKDSPSRQKKFREKNDFPFALLCDESGDTIRAYEAWGKKKLYGREYEGIYRISYLIDEQGTIQEGWEKVSPKTHGTDVLSVL